MYGFRLVKLHRVIHEFEAPAESSVSEIPAQGTLTFKSRMRVFFSGGVASYTVTHSAFDSDFQYHRARLQGRVFETFSSVGLRRANFLHV